MHAGAWNAPAPLRHAVQLSGGRTRARDGLVEFENRLVTHTRTNTYTCEWDLASRQLPQRSGRTEVGNFHGRDWCTAEYAEEIIRLAHLPRITCLMRSTRDPLVRVGFAWVAGAEYSGYIVTSSRWKSSGATTKNTSRAWNCRDIVRLRIRAIE